MRYGKPPLSIEEQLDLLTRRGLAMPDRDRARHYLSHINYYRLRAYWLPFEGPAPAGDHQFKPGTSLDDVVALYVFDRHLRLLVMDAIERIEVSVRTGWAHVMAMRHGAHAFLQSGFFRDPEKHHRALEALREEYERSHETFVEHYRSRYTDPALPPIWAACELMTIGQLSIWFSNVKARDDRKAVAAPYGLDESVLRSFMHHLTHVRNLCAHHSRLWNRKFTITMTMPHTPGAVAQLFNQAEPRRLHNTLAMLGYLLTVVSPESRWCNNVVELITDCPQAEPRAMGFPENWGERPPWRRA